VVGVIIALISAYVAKKARTIATEARNAVLTSSLAEEINLAQKLAAEVGNLVDLVEI
jgi:hypothetical protein